MERFSQSLTRLSASLVAQYDTIFDHRGNRGDSREKAVIEYLRRVVPSGFGFSKGEMFDQKGTNSGEVDIIIYDAIFSTVFHDGSQKILAPIESTYGAIECKSALTKQELEDSVKKIRSYLAMIRPSAEDNTVYATPDFSIRGGVAINVGRSLNVPTYGVFAYQSEIAQQTMEDILEDASGVDFVIVPGEFLYIGKENYLSRSDGTPLKQVFIRTPDAVAIWIIFLQIALSNTRLIAIDRRNILLQLLTKHNIEVWS